MEEKLRSFLKTGSDWARLKTSLPGVDSDIVRVDLGRMRLISAMWPWAHSTSMYGCLDVPASKIFRENEAKIEMDYAAEVQSLSAKFGS